jgi:hypothetical protein
MAEELLTFQRFKDAEVANDIAQKLKDANVFFEIENDEKFFDPTFAKNPMQNEIRIKLKSTDFSKANKVLDEYYKSQTKNIDKDYYLFEFSDRELLDILAKPDEWGNLDYQLAQKILKDRGREIKIADLEILKVKRISELKRPEKSQNWLILIGYVSSLFGGFIGIIIGLILTTSKRTLPNGEIVYTYCDSDRKHGRVISGIGLVIFTSAIFFRLTHSD